MKLTIEQLKNYLGTGLKINEIWITAYGGFDRQELDVTVLYHCRLDQIVPHCYRLSDLDKRIAELGFVPIEKLLQLIHQTWYNSHLDSRYSEIEIDSSEYYVKAYFKYMATLEINIRINDLENEKWWIIQQLFQWHFWPFGDEYFEAGLVIDKLLYNSPTN